MNKLITLVLIASLGLFLFSCGEDSSQTNSDELVIDISQADGYLQPAGYQVVFLSADGSRHGVLGP